MEEQALNNIQQKIQEMTAIFKQMSREELEEYEKNIDEAEKQEVKEKIEKRFLRCGASKRLLEQVGFDKFVLLGEGQEKLKHTIIRNIGQQYADNLKKGDCKNLIMCGQPGVGKTFLALSIMKELFYTKKDTSKYPAEWGIVGWCSGIYRTSDYLCEELRAAESFNSKISKYEMIERYSFTDLLVIDEVGRSSNKKESEMLFSVLDRRYQEANPSIIITNKSYQDLQKILGDALLDRLNEDGAIILDESTFHGMPSLRKFLKEKLKCR